jgi:uncharacterized membrane protein YheB (UPF0754 family)
LHNLGQNAVEKLVVEHEDGQVLTQFLMRTSDEQLVKVLLRHLSKGQRQEVKFKLMKKAPDTIKNLIETNWSEAVNYWMNILHLEYVIKYADSVLLLELLEIITQSHKKPHPFNNETIMSVWSSYLLCDQNIDRLSLNVDKFLLCIANKLSKSKVKELVLHEYHDDEVPNSAIGHAVSNREKRLVDAMLAHLTEEDRDEVQRDHVDTAVEEIVGEPGSSFKTNKSDEETGNTFWSSLLHLY